jgi:hypothetical protein
MCPQIRTTLVVAGHVLTPMFGAVRLPPYTLHKFCFPSIPPVTVVKRIITALDEQHSQVIMIPFYVHFAPFLTHLPSFLRDLAQWVSEFIALKRYLIIMTVGDRSQLWHAGLCQDFWSKGE